MTSMVIQTEQNAEVIEKEALTNAENSMKELEGKGFSATRTNF